MVALNYNFIITNENGYEKSRESWFVDEIKMTEKWKKFESKSGSTCPIIKIPTSNKAGVRNIILGNVGLYSFKSLLAILKHNKFKRIDIIFKEVS